MDAKPIREFEQINSWHLGVGGAEHSCFTLHNSKHTIDERMQTNTHAHTQQDK